MELKQKPVNSSSHRKSASRSEASSASIHQTSAVAIALEQEAQTQRNIASVRLGLRNAALQYYNSNFDQRALPANKELSNAVIKLAEAMRESDSQVYGEYYCGPGVSDVTTINIESTSLALNPVEFFNTSSSRRQLTGGTTNG